MTPERRQRLSPEDKLAAGAFRMEARAQRCCANPDCRQPMAHPWDAHHVIFEQELERRGLPLFDPRNALRLCRTCHFRFHQRIIVIPQSVLTKANLAYAREVLGDHWRDYLDRRYPSACPI